MRKTDKRQSHTKTYRGKAIRVGGGSFFQGTQSVEKKKGEKKNCVPWPGNGTQVALGEMPMMNPQRFPERGARLYKTGGGRWGEVQKNAKSHHNGSKRKKKKHENNAKHTLARRARRVRDGEKSGGSRGVSLTPRVRKKRGSAAKYIFTLSPGLKESPKARPNDKSQRWHNEGGGNQYGNNEKNGGGQRSISCSTILEKKRK